MMDIRAFLLNSKDMEKSAYFWNSASAMLNSFQTVIILMVISRIDETTDAGNFVIAYAIANLLIMIGKYGVRQYQVSDVKEQFAFRDYRNARILSTAGMMAAAAVYIAVQVCSGAYDPEKSAVVFLICGAKAVDAFEDVYHGMFQQHRRLDIAGKIWTIRLAVYIVEFMAGYYLLRNLVLTAAVCLITTVLLSLVLNGTVMRSRAIASGSVQPSAGKIKNLLADCFPVFVSTFLMAYVANAPKYAIDVVLTSREQAQFNYIFMPVFVISLLSTFIYQPMINRLAVLWHEGSLVKFWKLIFRQVFFVAGLTVLAMAGGALLGLPVLSAMYGVDLSMYRMELVILLLGGGMVALINFFTMVITVTRYQKHLMWGYLAVSLVFLVFGKQTAAQTGITGISVFYTAAVTALAITFLLYILVIEKIEKKRRAESENPKERNCL